MNILINDWFLVSERNEDRLVGYVDDQIWISSSIKKIDDSQAETFKGVTYTLGKERLGPHKPSLESALFYWMK